MSIVLLDYLKNMVDENLDKKDILIKKLSKTKRKFDLTKDVLEDGLCSIHYWAVGDNEPGKAPYEVSYTTNKEDIFETLILHFVCYYVTDDKITDKFFSMEFELFRKNLKEKLLSNDDFILKGYDEHEFFVKRCSFKDATGIDIEKDIV